MRGCTPIKLELLRRRPTHQYLYLFFELPRWFLCEAEAQWFHVHLSGSLYASRVLRLRLYCKWLFSQGPPEGLALKTFMNEYINKPCGVSAASLCPWFSSQVKGRASRWPHPTPLHGWHFPMQRISWLWHRVQNQADDSGCGWVLDYVCAFQLARSWYVLTEKDRTGRPAR